MKSILFCTPNQCLLQTKLLQVSGRYYVSWVEVGTTKIVPTRSPVQTEKKKVLR